MSTLTQKDIDLFAKKILEDYDLKDPGKIFKNKIQINNIEALLIQSAVSKLRKKRGEEIIKHPEHRNCSLFTLSLQDGNTLQILV